MSIFIKLIANGMRKSELVNTVFEKQEKLEEMSVLKTYVKKANGVPTVHYKLDKSVFRNDDFLLRNRKKFRNRKMEIAKTNFL